MPARPELTLRLPNSPGALAFVFRQLSAEHISIQAVSLDTSGVLRLVVDNHVRATAVLKERHRSLTCRDVIVVSGADVDALALTFGLVAEAGVNVEYAYSGAGGGVGIAVLGVDDAQRAAAAAGV